jgi:hypothetical protein
LVLENMTTHASGINIKGSSLDTINRLRSIVYQLEQSGEFDIGQAILSLTNTKVLNSLKKLCAIEIQAHSNGLKHEVLRLPKDHEMIPVYEQLKRMTSKAMDNRS